MDFLDEIRRESDAFYRTADGADPSLEVPSCPGWSIADLVGHLGEVHWFWATDIEIRATNPDDVEKLKVERPAGYQDLVAFGRSQADRLISILEANDDATPVWTWALNESDHTVGFIRRHQVQEAAVHRWDVQNAATKAADPIDPEAASDSMDELLTFTLPWCVNAKKPIDGSVHIHCTDTPGEWLIRPNGHVEPIHAKGDVAIRGAASDLLLALFKRTPVDDLDLVGNASLAHLFIERMNTE
jgi:uncharacterized protein (TIGR03083 family)